MTHNNQNLKDAVGYVGYAHVIRVEMCDKLVSGLVKEAQGTALMTSKSQKKVEENKAERT
jgi:hypothetical protein